MSTSLWCRGATSPAAWSFLGPTVWLVLLVAMAGAAARQVAVEASQQAAAQQATMLASQQVAEEAAPLAVPAPLWPPAGANRRVSLLMMMMYRPMRMSLSRSCRDGFLPPKGRAGEGLPLIRPMRWPRWQPQLTKRP
jgi:hypothetical protein